MFTQGLSHISLSWACRLRAGPTESNTIATMNDDDVDDNETEHDDEEELVPSDVFVSMAFGREGSEEAWKVIRKACKEFELEARRAHQNHFPGSPAIDEAIEALVDLCDFAVIDLTHERPSVAHEIGLCDREFDRAFILLIAKAGTPRFGNIQGRMVNYYSDMDDLRRTMTRQLRMMCEAWDEMPDEEEDEDGQDEDE